LKGRRKARLIPMLRATPNPFDDRYMIDTAPKPPKVWDIEGAPGWKLGPQGQIVNTNQVTSNNTERVTLYNINDPNQTKRVTVGKGENYTPDPGWTMKVPSTIKGGQWDNLSPDEKKPMIENFILTGKYPQMYYRDPTSKMAFNRDFAGIIKEKGMDASSVGAIRASYKALGQSMAQQEKSYGMMVPFVDNLNRQIDRVDDFYKKIVQRFGTKAVDVPIREFKTRFLGSGKEKALEAYMIEISNEIGKLSTSSQNSVRELSTEAQDRWSRIHDPALSLKEMKYILDETREMATMRQESAEKGLDFVKTRMESLLDGVKPKNTKVVTNPTTGEEELWDLDKKIRIK
jgi:hypothetical protein